MNVRSTVILGSLLAVSLTPLTAPTCVHARTPPPAGAAAKHEPDVLRRFEAAVPKLGLWPEQKPRIQKLVAEVRASLKKIEASAGTPEEKQARLKAVHAKAQDSLNHVLTVVQAEKLKKLMGDAPKPRK
jgi:Spy/CpxP family protein refolding chaperone